MLVKLIVGRPRPDGSFVQILQNATDPSFPSGHVVHYVVFFGFLYVVLFSLWRPGKLAKMIVSIAFFGLVGSISFSRVYLGVHWATDVIGGYLFGFSMLWILLHFYFKEKEVKIDSLPYKKHGKLPKRLTK
jgi:membrane-associated phospholipid phosphatase